MKLSILTATYNREKYLKQLYKSILQNLQSSNLEIQWIIIDDGSVDNTCNVVKTWKNRKVEKLEIKYIYQNNSGKMMAINRGIKEVTGNLVVDCDSDDFFSEKAFKIIEQNSLKLLQTSNLYALCFLKKDTNGKISGKKFKQNYMISTMFDLYFKDEIGGEKILVFNSKIRKKYKHELEKNEKFITESRMYHKLDEQYKILCINEAIEIGEYEEDGYTKNISKTFENSPCGYYKYFKEILQKGLKKVTLNKKIYIIKHYMFFLYKDMIKRRKENFYK